MLVYRKRKSTGAIETCGYATASKPIRENGTDVTIERSALSFTNPSLYDTPEYIMCATNKSKPSFAAQESDNVFFPLPCSAPLVGTIGLATGSEIRLLVYGVGPATATSGYDINRFLPSQTTAEYLGVRQGFRIFCELTSNTGTGATIPLTSVKLSVMQTLSTTGISTKRQLTGPQAMYTQSVKGGALTKVTSLSVPASGTVYVVFDMGQAGYMDDSGGYTDAVKRDHTTFPGDHRACGQQLAGLYRRRSGEHQHIQRHRHTGV